MKLISVIKNTIFSIFLIFIYWDSTFWKIAVNYLGENEKRITYGILSMGLFLTFSIIYFILFKLIESLFPKNKRKKIIKYPKSLPMILISVFCFKFLIFGDIAINIDNNQSLDKAIEVQTPTLKQGSLKIYKIGQVKGGYGWYDIYKGFYLLQNIKINKQYVICSQDVSGENLESKIYKEYTSPDKLFLIENKTIKSSLKGEVKSFLINNNLSNSTKIYSIKSNGFTLFFMQLLYWGVFALIIIVSLFLIILSLPESKKEKNDFS